jgi:HK97 gp10 family phage protein
MPISNIEITGLIETQRKLEQVAKDLSGEPMVKAIRESTLLVQRTAKEEVPVDTGQLRNSITSRVIGEAKSVTGIVGTNKKHAASVEFGRGPHIPDMGPLTIWARRHDVDVKDVAQAIQQYGTRAQPYMAPAVKANRDAVTKKIEDAVKGIVNQ